MFPYCLGSNLSEMSLKIHLAINDSKIRANIGVNEIGLSWLNEDTFLSLGTGIGPIVADFQTPGKLPSLRQVLKICVNGVANSTANSLISLTGKSEGCPALED